MTQAAAKLEIKKILKEFTLTEKVLILEELVSVLRQRNSIEMAREVEKFAIKTKSKKQIDKYPV